MTAILQEIKFSSEAFIDVRFIHENTLLQLLKDYQRCSWIQLVWEKMVHKSEYLEERRPGCARVGVPRTILPEDVTEPTTGIKFPTLLEDNSNRTAISSSGNSSGRRRSCSGEDGDLVQGAEDLAVAAAGGVVAKGGGRAVDDNDELGGRAASRRAPGAAAQRGAHAEQRRTSGILGAERSRR